MADAPQGVIRGHDEIRDAYRDDTVAARYVERRFADPLGAMLHARQRRYLLTMLATLRPERVLEVAPGPARLTVELDVADGTVMDASLQMLQEARTRLARHSPSSRWRLTQGDVFQLPFGESFDLVYTFRLIRHFDRRDRDRIYRQLRAALRPGGTLVFDAVNEVVSAPLRRASGGQGYEHYDALLRPEQIREELHAAGFRDVVLTGVQHRYALLRQCQVLVAPRSQAIARALIEAVDRTGGEPLEWIVSCRRPA